VCGFALSSSSHDPGMLGIMSLCGRSFRCAVVSGWLLILVCSCVRVLGGNLVPEANIAWAALHLSALSGYVIAAPCQPAHDGCSDHNGCTHAACEALGAHASPSNLQSRTGNPTARPAYAPAQLERNASRLRKAHNHPHRVYTSRLRKKMLPSLA
jgi:hypothetical protein